MLIVGFLIVSAAKMAVCSWLIVESPVTGCVSLTIDVVRLVARLGGFLARKGDGEPGVKTIWLGM